MLEQLTIDSPLGTLRLIARGDELAGVHLPDPDLVVAPDPPGRTNPVLECTAQQLAEYFAGTRTAFDVPVHAPGSAFEERVWRALCEIPFGETRSYEDIARVVGSPKGVRAVGRANGLNRIAIVIPCHRVVNKSGELGGYGGGLWRKRRLLHLEKNRSPRQDHDETK